MRSFLFLFLLSVAGSAAAEETPFRLNSGAIKPLSGDDGGFYNAVASELFRRLDMPLKYISLPSERSLLHANSGIDDGNIARIKGMKKKWPNLIMVPEPVIDWEFVAFSNTVEIAVDSWDSFKPYKLAFIRGWQIYENNAVSDKQIVRAGTPEQLFELLDDGRVEIVLFERWQGAYWLSRRANAPKRLSPPLAVKPLYIYVHQKHAALVPKLAAGLAAMKADGAYRKIFDSFFPGR